jgi:hypothetical protein
VVANAGRGGQQTNDMADLRFTCTHCGQEIECDELWSGREIQCPTCQAQLAVPSKPDGPPHAALASAKPGQARLSIGQSRTERSAAPPPPPPQMATLQQQLNQAKLAKKGNPMKWVTISAVIIVVAVGAYLGYPYLRDWMAKRSETAKQASAPPPVTNAVPAEPPPPPKELPVLPAVWTLDVDKAKIPEGKVNGLISGTNFVPEFASLDKVGTTYLLRLLQGTPAAPDVGFMVYLRLNVGESVTGHTWTVSQDLKDRTLPQVVKLWKTNPRYAAKQKPFSSGYAMKLELGQITNGVIPGKIFLALPDTEQSVAAGVFTATTTLADASGAVSASPIVAPSPVAPSPAPGGAERSAFDKRYGGRK